MITIVENYKEFDFTNQKNNITFKGYIKIDSNNSILNLYGTYFNSDDIIVKYIEYPDIEKEDLEYSKELKETFNLLLNEVINLVKNNKI